MGLSPPSAKKNLGPIPTSIFEWDLFHLEAVGPIPWDLVDFTLNTNLKIEQHSKTTLIFKNQFSSNNPLRFQFQTEESVKKIRVSFGLFLVVKNYEKNSSFSVINYTA